MELLLSGPKVEGKTLLFSIELSEEVLLQVHVFELEDFVWVDLEGHFVLPIDDLGVGALGERKGVEEIESDIGDCDVVLLHSELGLERRDTERGVFAHEVEGPEELPVLVVF